MQKLATFFLRTKPILALFPLLYPGALLSQPQSPLWTIPPTQIEFCAQPTYSSLDYDPLAINSYAGESPANLSNSIHDVNGHLVAYIVDESIYDRNGDKIDELKHGSLVFQNWAEEISVVPVPGSCTKYYLITGVYENGNVSGLPPLIHNYYPTYAILDMALQNINYPSIPTKRGALIYNTPTKNVFDLNIGTIPLAYAYPGTFQRNRFGIAVTPYRPLPYDNHFLFVSGTNGFYRYIIDGLGITFDNSSVPNPYFPTAEGDNINYSEMEVVLLPTGNYRLAKALVNYEINTIDLNYSDGSEIAGTNISMTIPTTITALTPVQIVGLEFSPNGRYLFFSNQFNVTPTGGFSGGIHYVDVSSPTTPPVFVNAGNSSLNLAQIEMGRDGIMYFNGQDHLFRFTNPDNPTTGVWSIDPNVIDAGTAAVPYHNLLPDQLDGQDYVASLYTGTQPCCVLNTHYTVETYTANITDGFSTSTTQVWTPTNNPFIAIYNADCPPLTVASLSTVIVSDKIIIPPGFNITIQGMKFEFKPRTYPPGAIVPFFGGRVLVQNSTTLSKGGRLTLQTLGTSPTEFTKYSGCNGLWEGVEVWGNHILAQSSFALGKQGWLRLYSTSTAFTSISYAYHGALAGKKDPLFNFIINTPSNGGGVIQANPFSEFKNNAEGVFFMPYNVGTNQSIFIEAKFLTTANLNSPDGVIPTNMAFLNDVRGIFFKRCAFENDPVIYPPVGLSSTLVGVRGLNSQFSCTPDFLATSIGCTFKNFRYAISANNGGALKTVDINHCIFSGNYRGVYLNLVNYANINSNSFTVLPYTASYISTLAAYGIYMNFSKAFSIEDNSFTAINKNANCYGVILNQTNPTRVCGQSDVLYRNRFNSIYIGAQTQGNNSELPDGSAPLGGNLCYPDPSFPSGFAPKKNNKGLVLKCNDFAQASIGLFDANVANTQSGAIVNGNIGFLQGLCVATDPTAPAGNSFSHSCVTINSDYKVSATATSGNPTNFEYSRHPASLPLAPTCYTPLPNGLLSIACATAYGSGSCLPIYNKPKSLIQFDIFENGNKLIAAELISDNGDSDALINSIATKSPGQIKNDLLAQSPYLSDRVLFAAINKGLSPGILKQILLANSPLSETVKAKLLTISLPNGILNEINAAQNGVSARTELFNYQSYLASQKLDNINALIRYFLNDTTIDTGVDSVKQIFLTYDLPEAHCELIKCLITKEDLANATTELNECRTSGECPSFCNYMDMFIALKSNNSDYTAISNDTSLLSKLDLVAADGNARESGSAEELKLFLQDVKFEEWIEPNEFSENHRSMIFANDGLQTEVSENHSMSVYPNPAHDQATILINLPENESTGVIEMYDITGRKLDTFTVKGDGVLTLNTTDYSKGLYVFVLYVDNEPIDNIKLAIAK